MDNFRINFDGIIYFIIFYIVFVIAYQPTLFYVFFKTVANTKAFNF